MKIKMNNETFGTKFFSIFVAAVTEFEKEKKIEDLGGFYEQNRDKNGECVFDIKLTINGMEYDVFKYFEELDKILDEKYDNYMRAEAIKYLKSIGGLEEKIEKFEEIGDLLRDLKDRVDNEIERRLEDWEKDFINGK